MKVFIKLLIFLVFPVLLLISGVVPVNQRLIVLLIMILGIVVMAIIERVPVQTLGFRVDNLKEAIIPYGVFTVLGVLFLVGLSFGLNKQPLPNWWTLIHLQWLFLPISAFQEFGYRAYFQTKLQKTVNPYLAIFIITILYSGMHILWKNPLVLAMSFFGGLGWGYLWYKHPNFYLISLSHSILNFLAVYLGFFPKI